MKAFSTISEIGWLIYLAQFIISLQNSASRLLFWYLIFETLTPHQKIWKIDEIKLKIKYYPVLLDASQKEDLQYTIVKRLHEKKTGCW